MEQKDLESVMSIIIHSGNAKSSGVEAIQEAKMKNFDLAEEKLNEANQEINKAHNAQTKLLSLEANGEFPIVSLLVVHSQDHLMTTMTFLEMAREFVELYKTIG
ncbi:PTS lactose/cellobiose transporter subunit IIA [Tuanshanicoccus lijuaniae]|uniref:PTS lactose/cellobiose transporter subunit IIA n=1 Tax=Aerococcaceae bacterium zg-1292 TaxID=2774330 RepID=UPI001BD8A0B3|nr:PTS lactose/cellobiose transporter subunit IIA [Aerococcaceae bacterium zg-A91]MBS4458411.1 PTS lactose/cellobiose transporter subunit IIA [Aerococcaceae bacterium zg-BR33]